MPQQAEAHEPPAQHAVQSSPQQAEQSVAQQAQSQQGEAAGAAGAGAAVRNREAIRLRRITVGCVSRERLLRRTRSNGAGAQQFN